MTIVIICCSPISGCYGCNCKKLDAVKEVKFTTKNILFLLTTKKSQPKVLFFCCCSRRIGRQIIPCKPILIVSPMHYMHISLPLFEILINLTSHLITWMYLLNFVSYIMPSFYNVSSISFYNETQFSYQS